MRTSRRSKTNDAKLRKLLGLGPMDRVPDLTLLANAEDEATGNATEIYIFRKAVGRHGKVAVPRDQSLFEPRSIAKTIAAQNGILPRDIERAVKLIKKASRAEPKQRYRYVRRDGWRQRGTSFCHRGLVYGRRRVGAIELKAPLSTRQRNHPLDKRGRLEDWRKILIMGQNSTRFRLSICAAFAAPLLEIIDLQSFIIVIAGPSKAGKSTALLASASVIGIGREGGLPNMNATGAALQETAAEFNDRVLPVNELALINGSKRDAYSTLRPWIFRYAEGRDTVRHSKSQYSTDAGTAEWRGIMLLSSENTVETLAESAGQKRDEGEYARAFDVPATRAGNPTVFDSFPRTIKPEGQEAWARQQLAAIRQLVAENHGVAFGPYINYLIKHRATLKREVEGAMREFVASLEGTATSGALQHAAQNFGVLYAGAVMAKKAGLVPWSLTKTRDALRVCFMDGLQEISRVEGAEVRARHAILNQIGRLRPLTNDPRANVEGWFTETRRGKVFAIKTAAFNDCFTNDEEQRAALRWLHQAGLLMLKDGAKPAFPNKEWAITFPKAAGKAYRCYQFLDPRTASASRKA